MTDFIFYVMKPLAIFAFSVVAFILVFRNTKSKRRPLDYYTNPDWNFFMKKWWARRRIVNQIKADQESHLKELKQDEIENPRPLESESSSDGQMFYGEDNQGNSLVIKITRRRHRISDVWLILRLADGRVFTLPDHPDTQIFNVNGESFNAGGLSMECLVPFLSWRIRFNGFLRQGVRKEWTNDLKEQELVFMKFNFLWQAKSQPLFWPFDWSSNLMATSSATEPWRDGNWLRLLEKIDSIGYDQYGAMLGEIFLNEEYFEINLPGMRQRRWGPYEVSHLRRKGVITGVCRNGMVFQIGAFSSNRGLTHAQFGNVILPSGDVGVIDWTDYHLRDLGENKSMRKAQSIRFKVGKQMFNVVIHCNVATNIPLFGGRPLEWHSNNYQIEFTINGEEGTGIASFWFPTDGKETPSIPNIPRYLRVHYSSVKPRKDKFIYHFTEDEASSVHISGGKGASLALLTAISRMSNIVDRVYAHDQLFKDYRLQHLSATRRGSISQLASPEYIVPSGFVLSVSAMDLMVKSSSELNVNLDKLVTLCAEGKDFAAQCELVGKLLKNIKLSDQIVKDVKSALQLIRDSEDVRIAVRSSSVCEDGEDVSAAGQNETFLGLRSEMAILDAIKSCWASLYTHQSVQYRKQNIQPIRTEMAVVVQVMLDADCAGVLFSQHPILGDVKKCLISANYGLGESVVSGEVDPDNFVVQRNYTDDKFKIVEKVLGKKGHKIQMNSENDVEKVQIEEQGFCISDDVVIKLSEIGVILEKLYGNGRDIEWALKNNRIFLLQSRPITALNQFSDWELIHEFDTPIMGEEDLCTTANIQEVMPGAVCPLTQDILKDNVEKCVLGQIVEDPLDINFNRMWVISRNHIFMDLYKIMFRNNTKEIQMDKRIACIAFAGHDLITPEMHQKSLKRFAADPSVGRKMGMMMLKTAWKAKKAVKRSNALSKSFNCQYSSHNLVYFENAQKLLDNICSHFQLLFESCFIHCTISSVSTFYNIIACSILAGGSKTFTETHLADNRLISSSVKDTESADVPKKLEMMAKEIFASGKKDEFCAVAPEEGANWLEKNIPKVHSTFQTFIEHNKHRGFKEFDVSSLTWGVRPGIIIEMLQTLLKLTTDISSLGKTNEVAAMSPSELINAIQTPVNVVTKMILKKVIGWAQAAVINREQTKSNAVGVVHEFRLAFRHLGKMMTEEGLLHNPDLVFYLKQRELKLLLKTRDVNLVKKAMRRQKIWPELEKDRYPELLWGVPQPLNKKKDMKFESGTEIRGTPVYSGVVTGRACVIHHFSEVSKIEPGDILITYSTDIGWSPYFPILGGVVTEIGGLISHGAVVAREYGLPCIVAAENATSFFTFGETITLDSKNGVIFKGTGN